MGWTIRRATEHDAEAIQAVAGAGWRDTYRGLLRDDTIEAFLAGPYGIDNVRRRIATDDFLVAEWDGAIAAYADAVQQDDRIFLAAIYALPEHRSHGAGSALLEAVASRHPDLPIDANVLLGNRKGEPFYERRGFVPVETVEGDLFGESVTERRWRKPQAGDTFVHRVVESDWERLRAIRLSALADSPAAFASTYAEEVTWTPERWREWASASGEGAAQATFVAVRSGSWLALATGARHRERPGAILYAMWVAPTARRQGLGRRLVEAVITWARDHHHTGIWLRVAAGNSDAMRLYSGIGFEATGVVEGNAIEMSLEFGAEPR